MFITTPKLDHIYTTFVYNLPVGSHVEPESHSPTAVHVTIESPISVYPVLQDISITVPYEDAVKLDVPYTGVGSLQSET